MPHPAIFARCGKNYPAKTPDPANFAGFFIALQNRSESRKAFVLSQKLIFLGLV